jgi:FtsZ-binding cell division protein ZapB
MTEISDLKRRVDAVGEKFGRLAEQENRYGERLAGLLNAVEEGFARSQSETQTLKDELESARDEIKTLSREVGAKQEEAHQHRSEIDGLKEEREKLASEIDGLQEEREKLAREIDGAKDESKQLRGMLLTLLEAVESGGNLDIGTAMRKLESRIDRIVTSTDGPSDIEPAPKPPEAAPAEVEPAEVEPAGAESAEDEFASVDDVPLQLTARAEPAPVDTDSDEAEPEQVADEAAASTDEPVTPAEPEASEDLEEPKEPVRPKSLKKVAVAASKAAEPPSDDDLSAVNKIIQRISLLTGEFVEPSPKHSAAGQDKSVPSLKVDNSADGEETGSDTDSATPGDESTAKSR